MRDVNICLEEFEKFYNLIIYIPNYKPWFFPVTKEGKQPDHNAIAGRKWKSYVYRFSWKAEHAQLNYDECIMMIKKGYNIGISASENDELIIIDIDNPKYLDNMPPNSLINRSRSRFGLHGFYIKGDDKVKTNIPTDYGEMRCVDQYVLAPGSYVPVTDADLDKYIKNGEITSEHAEIIKQDKYRGYYTVEIKEKPRNIIWSEIPEVFKKQKEKNIEAKNKIDNIKAVTTKPIGKHSALFDLKISNIVKTAPGRREPHPLHESDTGQNFSINPDGTLCHCWRHCVSLNTIQFLVVRSGYMSCQDAGTPHKKGGYSKIRGDNGAIFWAWRQAKRDNLIPKDDQIPSKALVYIAYINRLIDNQDIDRLPSDVFAKTIKLLEEGRWKK